MVYTKITMKDVTDLRTNQVGYIILKPRHKKLKYKNQSVY